MLGLVLETRQAELKELLEELDEVKYVLALRNME